MLQVVPNYGGFQFPRVPFDIEIVFDPIFAFDPLLFLDDPSGLYTIPTKIEDTLVVS